MYCEGNGVLMRESDKSLLDKAKKGDVQAFEDLIEGYQKRVFNITLRMIGNYDDASELTQEVFIRVFRSLNSFKEEAQFSTWVYKIATNICLDELRKQKKRKAVISLDEEIRTDDGEIKRQIEDEKPTPDIIAEKNEMKNIVNKAIQSLSEEYRFVIIMRDIQGFSYEEIAKIIKCPEGTVKSRINRARKALKEALEDKKELLYGFYVK
ncbi:MAG: sigma-70 family RNA polymerase sigma factor [Bacillota bacterium]|nr:sigma-70 family RNA polymerase sigma factor [Bacillota bacterium]